MSVYIFTWLFSVNLSNQLGSMPHVESGYP